MPYKCLNSRSRCDAKGTGEAPILIWLDIVLSQDGKKSYDVVFIGVLLHDKAAHSRSTVLGPGLQFE
jgi:hypothetical protein